MRWIKAEVKMKTREDRGWSSDAAQIVVCLFHPPRNIYSRLNFPELYNEFQMRENNNRNEPGDKNKFPNLNGRGHLTGPYCCDLPDGSVL